MYLLEKINFSYRRIQRPELLSRHNLPPSRPSQTTLTMEASSDTHHTSTDENDTVVVQTEPSSTHVGENGSETDSAAGDSLSKSSDVLAKGLSSILSSVITDFDFRAQQTLISQNHLSSSIDRLTGGIFFLLFSILCSN